MKPDLTKRHKEVIRLLAEGLCNKDIAVRLGISHTTVSIHLNEIRERLGIPPGEGTRMAIVLRFYRLVEK